MKQEAKKAGRQNQKVKADPPDQSITCEMCGAFGAFHLGERIICESCYEGSGSCCPEFGKTALWDFPDAS